MASRQLATAEITTADINESRLSKSSAASIMIGVLIREVTVALNPSLKPDAADALNAAAGVDTVAMIIDGPSANQSVEAPKKAGIMDRLFGPKSKGKPGGKKPPVRGLSDGKPPPGDPLPAPRTAASPAKEPDPELTGLVQLPFVFLAQRYGPEMVLSQAEAVQLAAALGAVLDKYGWGALKEYEAELGLLAAVAQIGIPRIQAIQKAQDQRPAPGKPLAPPPPPPPENPPPSGFETIQVVTS